MPKAFMIYLAKDGFGEKKMVTNWPKEITTEVIQKNYPRCRACLEAQSRKAPFQGSSAGLINNSEKIIRTKRLGQLGQLDMWAPYPKRRQGVYSCVHINRHPSSPNICQFPYRRQLLVVDLSRLCALVLVEYI